MISVIIPTFNAQDSLPGCLAALLPATVDGLIKQVIIVDGGSHDRTGEMAEAAGADVIASQKGRGVQLAAGADQARAEWLLFLHADTILQPGWATTAARFIDHAGAREAGYFRFRLDDSAVAARLVEAGVALRCAVAGLPYGDQGLLISRTFHDSLGGYKPMALMEDVDMVDRIKAAGRLTRLDAIALTGAERYRRDGYARRIIKNWRCILAYKNGKPVDDIRELYR